MPAPKALVKQDEYVSVELYNEFVSKLAAFDTIKKAEYLHAQAGLVPIIDKWLALYGGDQLVFDMIRNGITISEISKKLGMSPATLIRWKNQSQVRRLAFKEAKADAAHLFVEQAELLLEELAFKEKVSSKEIKITIERVKFLKWKASMLNRNVYGKSAKTQVNTKVENNIDLNSLHLTAVKKAGAEIMAEVIESDAA